MTIEKIRNEISNNLGNKVKITINCSRNKIEKYKGVITETYPYIFIIKVNNEKKSFSYTDILTNVLEIKYQK